MHNMKVALITGSTSGIGLGIAKEFAKVGYAIAFNGLEENGAEIAEEVGKTFHVKTRFYGADLRNSEQIYQMIQEVESNFGHIDVLVNNAGIQFVSPIEDFPVEKWNAIIDINMNSVFHASKGVWIGMKQRGFGRIINIASAHGLVASPFKSAYVTAKHGVVGMTKTLGLEGAPFGITVNAICPGYVKTPLVEKQIKEQAIAHGIPEDEVISKIMLEKHAVKEFVTVEALGSLAVFLASESGKLITGIAMPVDGGWTAQ
jgi:3-hydroxybutyrate dehydrogenase